MEIMSNDDDSVVEGTPRQGPSADYSEVSPYEFARQVREGEYSPRPRELSPETDNLCRSFQGLHTYDESLNENTSVAAAAADDPTEKKATYSLVVGGDRLIPVNAEEARHIVARLKVVVAKNEGRLLTTVNLGSRTYREDGVKVLGDFFTADLVKNVTILYFDDMIAGVQTDPALTILKSICDMFVHCTVKFVDLSDNALGNRGLIACDSVLGKQNQLEGVKFENNGLAAESMAELERQLAGSEHLTTIEFENNMVGPEGADHFAGIVRTCPKLHLIKYAQVRAGLEGTRAVLKAIVDNRDLNLVSLDLNGGKLFSDDEEDGIELLGRVLAQNPTLSDLNIADCEITDDGVNQVMPLLLEANLSLKSLNLSENELSPHSCRVLAKVLRQQRPSLRTFEAFSNELTSVGVKTLMGAYDVEGTVLEVFSLTDNELGHLAAVALTGANLPNLQQVTLSGNGFTLRDVARLQNHFGAALQELEDNVVDAKFDGEGDDEIEEGVEAATEAPQQEPMADLRVVAAKHTFVNDFTGEKKASLVFDCFDQKKLGTLSMDLFENMMEELGEGFYGVELEQLKILVDPNCTHQMDRSVFVSWYGNLCSSTGSDDDPLHSEEREAKKKGAEKKGSATPSGSFFGGDTTVAAKGGSHVFSASEKKADSGPLPPSSTVPLPLASFFSSPSIPSNDPTPFGGIKVDDESLRESFSDDEVSQGTMSDSSQSSEDSNSSSESSSDSDSSTPRSASAEEIATSVMNDDAENVHHLQDGASRYFEGPSSKESAPKGASAEEISEGTVNGAAPSTSLQRDEFYTSGTAAIFITRHFMTGEKDSLCVLGNPSPTSLMNNMPNTFNPKKYSGKLVKKNLKTKVEVICGQTYVVHSTKEFAISEMIDGVPQKSGPSSNYHVGTSKNDILMEYPVDGCKAVLKVVSKDDLLVIPSYHEEVAKGMSNTTCPVTAKFAEMLLSLMHYAAYVNGGLNVSYSDLVNMKKDVVERMQSVLVVDPNVEDCGQLQVFGRKMVERACKTNRRFIILNSSPVNENLEGYYSFLLPPEALQESLEDGESDYQALHSARDQNALETNSKVTSISKAKITFSKEKASKHKEVTAFQPGRSFRLHRIGRAAPAPAGEFLSLRRFQNIEALVSVLPGGVLLVPVSKSMSGAVVLETDDGVRSTVNRGSVFFPLVQGGNKRVDLVRFVRGQMTTVTMTFSAGSD